MAMAINVIEIASLKPTSGGSPRFEGSHYGASVSFFVVMSAPGKGADKHRHPYEETFVILEGVIEVIVDGKMQSIGGGNIVVIPPNTWHEFKNRSSQNALMVNIHPVPEMIQEFWA
jgi:quercetin dioxygenase-like cupin family protein